MATYLELYKAVWFWKGDGLEFSETLKKPSSNKTQTKNSIDESDGSVVRFSEDVGQTKEKYFKQKYQRSVREQVPDVVTIEDIKQVVTYLAMSPIPKYFLSLFHSYEINSFLRALIVYFQLYLQVEEDLKYRRKSYVTRLKHPSAVIRETICKTQLSNLRSHIGQSYGLLIVGSGKFNQFHHMNNSTSRSNSIKDIKLYKLLMSFSVRLVWIALGRMYFNEIENEMKRLFSPRYANGNHSRVKISKDQEILHGKLLEDKICLVNQSTVIREIYLNKDKVELLSHPHDSHNSKFKDTIVYGTYALLYLPEELFERFGLVLGILGLSRVNFEPMLHRRKEQMNIRTTFIELLELPQTPYIKLYEYLTQLNTIINLKKYCIEYGVGTNGIQEQIILYERLKKEDNENAFALWTEQCQRSHI